MELEEGDIVLCTVDRIIGTTVFVKIEGNGEGSIILSEIAPGRIRNLRDYVVPKKKIVCKILKIDSSKNIHLSLRRVTQKERKEILEIYNLEKSYESILKKILKEKADEIVQKILKEKRLHEFFQEAREKPKILEKFFEATDAKKILEIISFQKQKKVVLKKEFSLNTAASDGIEIIKSILGKIKDAELKYLSAGKYSIKTESNNIKTADNKLKIILNEIEEKAKENNLNFEIKEK